MRPPNEETPGAEGSPGVSRTTSTKEARQMLPADPIQCNSVVSATELQIPTWLAEAAAPAPVVPTIADAFDWYQSIGIRCCAIAPNNKSPSAPQWQKLGRELPEAPPEQYGLGLLHVSSKTCALDIDDLAKARELLAEHEIDLDALLAAPDAVRIDSGRPGRAKLIYRLGDPLPTRKVVRDGQTILELRCATTMGDNVQDVLPPSVHPDTGQPYQWVGQGTIAAPAPIPPALLAFWQGLLRDGTSAPIVVGGLSSSWDEVRSALFAIDPSCSRAEWIRVGMALKMIGADQKDDNAAFALFNEWSSGSKEKYKVREIADQWRSFKTDVDGVGIGSLFYLARTYGWERPTPDVTGMFGEVASPPGTGAWPEPSPFGKVLLPVEPFDYSMLPTDARAFVRNTAQRNGWAPDYLAVAMMVVCASLIGRKVNLRPQEDGWTVTPNLFCVAIGDPGAAKSPALSAVVGLLHPLIVAANENLKVWEDLFVAEKRRYDSLRKALCKQLDDRAKDLGTEKIIAGPWAPSSMNDEELMRISVNISDLDEKFCRASPKKKIHMFCDTTPEKLFMLLCENPQGMLFYLDELSALLAQMKTDNFATLRPFVLKCWSGSEIHDRNRVSDDSPLSGPVCLSVLGGIQPDLLPDLLGKTGTTDGLPQRFLMVWPDIGGHEYQAATLPVDDAAAALAQALLARLDARPMPQDGPALIGFSKAAQREFYAWNSRLKADAVADLHNPINNYVSKYPKQIVSIAIILAIAEGMSEVGVDEWRRALLWERYLRSHLERVLDAAGSGSLTHANALLSKIVKSEGFSRRKGHSEPMFSTRDVIRSYSNEMKRADFAKDVLMMLADAGYLREGGIRSDRGAENDIWYVNPAWLAHARGKRAG